MDTKDKEMIHMRNQTTMREDNAGVFKRALNGFYETQWYRAVDRDNLGALKNAILIERQILADGYVIEYEVGRDGHIRRADRIIDTRQHKAKQVVTLAKKYGHLVDWGEVESSEDPSKSLKNYGKIAYNSGKKNVGIIGGYSLDNTGTIWRYSLSYVKHKNDTLILSTTAWNEDKCVVFDSKDELVKYIEEKYSSDKNVDINERVDMLLTKLNLLNYKGK